jgi:hypothetical protein
VIDCGVGIIFGCLSIYQAKEEEAWHELKREFFFACGEKV